jgi:hypothetical protein
LTKFKEISSKAFHQIRDGDATRDVVLEIAFQLQDQDQDQPHLDHVVQVAADQIVVMEVAPKPLQDLLHPAIEDVALNVAQQMMSMFAVMFVVKLIHNHTQKILVAKMVFVLPRFVRMEIVKPTLMIKLMIPMEIKKCFE